MHGITRSDALASLATLIGVSFSQLFGPAFRVLDPGGLDSDSGFHSSCGRMQNDSAGIRRAHGMFVA